jgi:5-methylcytosine-specific restriction endonuclease McrA
MMARLSNDLRRQIIERAGGRCEYCQTPQAIVVEMELDHVIPQSAGGTTDLDNLCLACVGCNGFKLAFQEAEDPETEQLAPLFNPRRQRWADHFAWSDDNTQIIGLTPTGRATVMRLRLNRERLVQARRLWVQIGWHPPRP